MKKILFLLAAIGAFAIGAMLPTVDVKAQCNGVFPNNTLCGNVSGSAAPPAAVPTTAISVVNPSVNWINVKSTPCNAVGNGIADDTAAINTCIATFNNTSNGVLYFPAGTYLTTTGLTPVTANGIIRGDGITNLSGTLSNTTNISPKYTGVTPIAATLIETTSISAQAFIIKSQALLFSDLSLKNITSTTPTAGAGIVVTSNAVGQKVDYQNVEVSQYFDGIDIQVGNGWSMSNVFITDPVRYGIRIRNTVDPDYGDWSINNLMIWLVNRSPTDGIRLEGSGGGKIVNFKINGGGSQNSGGGGQQTYTNGIEVVPGGNATSDLAIVNGSIEWVSGVGINVNGSWPNITIANIEIGFGGMTNAISLTNTSFVTLSHIIYASGSPAPVGTPILLSGSTNVLVSDLIGFTKPFSGGAIPDHDATGGIGGQLYATATSAGALTLASTSITFTNPQIVPGGNFVTVMNAVAPNLTSNTNSAINVGVANGAANWMTQFFNFQGSGSTSNAYNFQFNSANNPSLTMPFTGHIAFPGGGGPAPTIAGGCGGTSSVVAGNDTNALVTGQNSNVTSCIIQFGTAFTTAPVCVASGVSSPLLNTINASTTSLTVHFTGTTSYQWSYICHGT